MKCAHWILLTAFALTTMALGGVASARPRAIDVQHSKMTISVYKQGLFSFFGDNHAIDAPIASGSYDAATKSIELTVEAAKLQVLDPKLAPSRRDAVESNMTGSQVLDAGKYPTIVFRSTNIDDRDTHQWLVTGNLTLHGQTHLITFQVVQVDPGHFTGSATVRQTAFGITPIQVAGGSVSVKDEVKIDFEILLTKATP